MFDLLPADVEPTEADQPTTDLVTVAPPEPIPATLTNGARRTLDPALAAARAGAVLVGVVTVILFVRLRPDLLLSSTTPTGGDNGAHIWTADYVRRELLPKLRVTGWSNDWFSGVPVLGFYFPFPTWLIVALSFVLPYGTAFKLITVLGILTLPALCYRLGVKAKLPATNTLFLGLAAVPFLLLRHFRILGGNILSTMAGEFSFSISLSLVVLYAGLLIAVLRTGRGRGRAALVLGLAALSHIVPTLLAMFFTVGAVIAYAERSRWRRQLRDLTAVGATGVAIAGFWVLPFGANLAYTNSMDYEKNRHFLKTLFPFFPHSATLHTPSDTATWACVAIVLAAVAVVAGIAKRDRFIGALSITAALSAAAFCVSPQGAMWNNRLLPLWFFCVYLLAGQGVVAIARLIGAVLPMRPTVTTPVRSHKAPKGSLRPVFFSSALIYVIAGPAFGIMPGAIPVPVVSNGKLSFDALSSTHDFKQSGLPFAWAASNEDGAQRKPGWDEYKRLVDALDRLPSGRALYEYDKGMSRYGTPMALMALPFWTNSKIQSSEGLFFEASATTPFHFVTASLVTATPSNPQRRLPYQAFDLVKGIDRMRRLGIRYYIASSAKALAAARSAIGLRLVAQSKPFDVFEITDNAVITPLTTEPVVATGIRGSLDGGFIDLGLAAWTDPARFPDTVALDGPTSWQRAAVTVTPPATTNGKATIRGTGVTIGATTPRALPTVTITDAVVGNERISFHVDRVGVPVLVRISAFPNWTAHGANGPYRVDPNFMVVVPTSNDVHLDFGYSGPDRIGWTLTLGGLAGGIALWRLDRRRRAAPVLASETSAGPCVVDGPAGFPF